LKTAWTNVRENAKVTGRFHDNRHTLITELAESGAGDQKIMDIAGHVSKQMLKHYSHIRMEAKRTALESIVKKQTDTGSSSQQTGQAEGSLQKSLHGLQNGARRPKNNHATAQPTNSARAKKTEQQCSEMPVNTQHFEGESLQKSLQSCNSEGHRGVTKARKSKNLIGSSGRTRIINQTYFQQHAGQRMTSKTVQSSRKPINRAQMERVHVISPFYDLHPQLLRPQMITISTASAVTALPD
jgi:hypothetical protein